MGEGSAKIFDWVTSPEIVECRASQPTMTSEQTRQLITDLLYEPSETALLDELESIKTTLNPKTPISWLKETLNQELWEEEIFQGVDVHPILGKFPPDNMGSAVTSPRILSPDTSSHNQNMTAFTDEWQHGMLGLL
jgi:hypothetical protein